MPMSPINAAMENLPNLPNLHEEHERFHFNGKFFRRFWNLLKTIFPRWTSGTSWLFIALLCTVLLEQVIIYNVGLIPSKFYKCLGDKDKDAFQALMLHALGLVVAVAFVMATDKYICNVFYVASRSIVTKHLHKEYFKDIHYYQLNVLDNAIDNPDQRITQDVDRTCNKFSEILARLIISPFTIAYYVYQTWTSTGYLGPLCVVGFFFVSTLINKLLMSPVVALVYKQEQLEGDFRFKHMQIRSNAESAAFYRCGSVERNKADARLGKLVDTQQKLVMREYFLSFSIQCADYLGSILSYIILAIPIFMGKYDNLTPSELSALISKNAFITIYLISCFTRLIDMAAQVTDLAGTTHRIGQLMDELSSLEEVSQDDPPSTRELMNTTVPTIETTNFVVGKVAYSLEGVSYTPPGSDRMLVKDLTWQLARGTNVLVTGDSGCGKTSLLRVLDGLWNTTCSGSIERPVSHDRNGVLYLPQKPFLTDGTLRQQITYPYKEHEPSRLDDHDVIKLLQEADLMALYDRLGGLDVPIDWNWFDMLSPGEMQRLAFVRLFYYKPPFAVLDEATSQLGLDMEHKLYTKCRELDITLLSVGHRDTLRQFHDVQLRLLGQGGGWELKEIHPTQ